MVQTLIAQQFQAIVMTIIACGTYVCTQRTGVAGVADPGNYFDLQVMLSICRERSLK